MYLDHSVSSGPFWRFSMRFEFLSEIFDYSVCETRDLSLTILLSKIKQSALLMLIQFCNVDAYSNCVTIDSESLHQ